MCFRFFEDSTKKKEKITKVETRNGCKGRGGLKQDWLEVLGAYFLGKEFQIGLKARKNKKKKKKTRDSGDFEPRHIFSSFLQHCEEVERTFEGSESKVKQFILLNYILEQKKIFFFIEIDFFLTKEKITKKFFPRCL